MIVPFIVHHSSFIIPAVRRAIEGTDRGLAVLAHASIGFGFLGIGFLLGLAINVIIWLRSRRSSYLAVQSEQAGAYQLAIDRKSTRLNSSHANISYAGFCLKKKT